MYSGHWHHRIHRLADVAVAAAHLYIVSGLEYVGMIIIVVFHMHEGGIRIGL